MSLSDTVLDAVDEINDFLKNDPRAFDYPPEELAELRRVLDMLNRIGVRLGQPPAA